MIPSRRQLMKYAAKVFDLCALVTSFVLATAALYPPPEGMTFAGFMAMRIKLGNSLLFGLLLVTWHSLFILCGLYVSKRLIRRRTQIFEVLRATLLVAAFLLVSAKIFKIQMVTFTFVLIFGQSARACNCWAFGIAFATLGLPSPWEEYQVRTDCGHQQTGHGICTADSGTAGAWVQDCGFRG